MTETIKEQVRDKYGKVARQSSEKELAGSGAVAQAFGYSEAELASIPAEANMGLSCGNPLAFAEVKPGDVVVDLGCGGGLDVLLAAPKVGPTGKVIGIDMTQDMIDLATKNAAKMGVTNVAFHRAEIESLPLPDASVDCVISNCVLNLVPDKPRAFKEIFRVLKPGGKLKASDIALKKPLPEQLASSIEAYIGCIAGALLVDDYTGNLRAAGFEQVELIDTNSDLNAYTLVEGQSLCCGPAMDTPAPTATASACCSPAPTASVASNPLAVVDTGCCSPASSTSSVHEGLAKTLAEVNVNDYAGSYRVIAVRPTR